MFTQDMNNLALSETTPLNSIVYTLEGFDPEGANVTFGLIGSDNFEVNPTTGNVKLIKELDREVTFFSASYATRYKQAGKHVAIKSFN